jgi:hypothetical protein
MNHCTRFPNQVGLDIESGFMLRFYVREKLIPSLRELTPALGNIDGAIDLATVDAFMNAAGK